jgi:CheY-like chemotaxis protein
MTACGPILVVDDDEDIRDIIVVILAENGYQAVGAVDGLDALRRLSAGLGPALVLIDLMMPRLSGVELANSMRADPRLASIPIVVLSGDRAARRISSDLGASDILIKPVNLDDLLATVGRYVPPATETFQPQHPS